MIRLDSIGRMLLGAAIFRSLRRARFGVVIAVAVVGLLLMFGGTARAQTPLDNAPGIYPTRPHAYAACQARIPFVSVPAGTPVQCHYEPGYDAYAIYLIGSSGNLNFHQGYWAWADECPFPAQWDDVKKQCDTPCSQKPPMPPGGLSNVQNPSGSASVCKDGCTYEAQGVTVPYRIDGTLYHTASGGWNPTGAQCSSTPSNTPGAAPSDSDGDGSSDGFDPSPNNPGSGGGGGADGEAQGEDGHCGGEGQPACGDPGAGSGNGNTSGGGGNCLTPPTSTGDPILAQIAYQTWATRCALEGKGNAIGGGNGDEQPAWTKGGRPPVPGGEDDGDIAGAKRFGIGIGPNLLDDTDIFGGGTCPQFSFQIAGKTISSSEYPEWCNVVAIMRALILIFGAYTALRILMGSD